MEKFFEKEGVMDSNGHVCIMKMCEVADGDADFFWEQLVEYFDDEESLATIVSFLTRLYLQRNMKAMYWAFAVLKGQGIALPPIYSYRCRICQSGSHTLLFWCVLPTGYVEDAGDHGRAGAGGVSIRTVDGVSGKIKERRLLSDRS